MDGNQNMEMVFSMTEKNLLTVMAVAEDTEYARMILLGTVNQWATERMISLKLLQINLMENIIMEKYLLIAIKIEAFAMAMKNGMLLWEIVNGMKVRIL